MKCAAEIFRLDEARKFPGRGCFEFSAILAQFGRDVIEIERAIQIRFLADRRNLLRRLLLFCFRVRRRFAEPIFV